MTLIRALSYLLGAAGSMALAGQFWGAKTLLGRLFAAYLLVGAINCTYLMALLIVHLLDSPWAWDIPARTANALLIGLVPVCLFFTWAEAGRKNGGSPHA